MIRKLAEMFPDAKFNYWYEETGMGFFGREIYEHGMLKHNLEGETSEYCVDPEDEESSRINNYLEGRDDEEIMCLFAVASGFYLEITT